MANRRDLTLSDSFHRVKRTALLLSTAVIVTFVPGIAVSEGAGLIGLSLKGVEIDLVRASLWLAALYYVVGFGSELLQERQAHSADVGLPAVEALNVSAATVDQELANLLDVIRRLPARFRSHFASNPDEDGPRLADARQRTLQDTEDYIAETRRLMSAWLRESRSMRIGIFSLRFAYFYIWEFGGVALAFGVASILVWSQVDGLKVCREVSNMLSPPVASMIGANEKRYVR